MELKLHSMVGKKYSCREAIELEKEIEAHPLEVDFRLLWELHQEFPDYTTGDLIGYLEMNEIPMTEAVRKLGICAGILYA